MRDFAPDYPRNERDLVLFPRDTDLRAKLFPALDPTMHIAKQNAYMVEELIKFVSDPGEHILDPFGGTGTTLVGISLDRNITLIELEEPFQRIIESNIKMMQPDYPDIDERAMLIPGDSFKILPIPDFCDHMIFSPPYPMGLKKKSKMSEVGIEKAYGAANLYSAHPDNFTNLNTFLYHQRIEIFYKKCLQTVRPGGTMTIIIKDHMEQGKRQKNPERTLRDCLRMGWELYAQNKWYAPGGAFTAFNRAEGLETVDEEDLITVRRPA